MIFVFAYHSSRGVVEQSSFSMEIEEREDEEEDVLRLPAIPRNKLSTNKFSDALEMIGSFRNRRRSLIFRLVCTSC